MITWSKNALNGPKLIWKQTYFFFNFLDHPLLLEPPPSPPNQLTNQPTLHSRGRQREGGISQQGRVELRPPPPSHLKVPIEVWNWWRWLFKSLWMRVGKRLFSGCKEADAPEGGRLGRKWKTLSLGTHPPYFNGKFHKLFWKNPFRGGQKIKSWNYVFYPSLYSTDTKDIEMGPKLQWEVPPTP